MFYDVSMISSFVVDPEFKSDLGGDVDIIVEFDFRGNYLKLVRSRNISLNQFELINSDVLISPEEVSFLPFYS